MKNRNKLMARVDFNLTFFIMFIITTISIFSSLVIVVVIYFYSVSIKHLPFDCQHYSPCSLCRFTYLDCYNRSKSKTYYLQAADRHTMMYWLQQLQKKRRSYSRRKTKLLMHPQSPVSVSFLNENCWPNPQ